LLLILNNTSQQYLSSLIISHLVFTPHSQDVIRATKSNLKTLSEAQILRWVVQLGLALQVPKLAH
jgi:hypothetical protein